MNSEVEVRAMAEDEILKPDEEETEDDPQVVGYRDGYLDGYDHGVSDGRKQGREAALFYIRMAFKDNYDPDVREVIQQLTNLDNT